MERMVSSVSLELSRDEVEIKAGFEFDTPRLLANSEVEETLSGERSDLIYPSSLGDIKFNKKIMKKAI